MQRMPAKKPDNDAPLPAPAGRPRLTQQRANAGQNIKCLRSEDLFNGSDVILIDHDGDTYMLRKTRNGKLILTK